MRIYQKVILIILFVITCLLLYIVIKNNLISYRPEEPVAKMVIEENQKEDAPDIEKGDDYKEKDYQESNSEKAEIYRGGILSELEKYHLSGSALIIKDDLVVYNRGLGFSNKELGIENTPSSEYMLASAQKSITATAIMILVEAGKLELDQMLSDYFPEVTNANNIRIRDLIDMTSGLKMEPITRKATTEEGSLEEIINSLVPAESHQSWRYVSENYSLLAGVVREVSGESFKKFVTDNIFIPLGLKHTGFYQDFKGSKMRTENYKNDGVDLYKNKIDITDAYYSGEIGASGIYSTTTDFYKFCKSLLTGELIGSDAREILFTNNPQLYRYTYAGGLYHRGTYKMSHGIIKGYESKVLITPDASTAVILLTNSKGDNDLNENIARSLFNIVTDYQFNVD